MSSPSPPPPHLAVADGEGETRDWSEMPSDALASVFGKLDAPEILMGAGVVCRAWHRLTTTDPTLWRRVDMRLRWEHLAFEKAEAMTRAAVDRSAGTMEAFWAHTFVSDNLLRYMSPRASALKSLHLSFCHISTEVFSEAIKGFPQLEELDIIACSLFGSVCEAIGKACPQLKCFRLEEGWSSSIPRCEHATYEGKYDNTGALGIASTMPGLQHLQLRSSKMTNCGLMAILECCPHLESLYIHQCYNIRLNDALESKCARIKNTKIPYYAILDLKFPGFEFDQLDVVAEDDDAGFDDMDDSEDDADTVYDEFDI